MSGRKRPNMLKKLILVILVFLLLVAAAYYLYLRSPTEQVGPVPDLVALAPRDAEWIAYLDLAAWRSSAMLEQLQKLAPEAREGAEYREFVNSTGFDYARDLDRAVLALVPVGGQLPARRSDFRSLVIAEGRFDRGRITAHALQNGFRENHQGQEILVVHDSAALKSPNRNTGQSLLAFLGAQRVALADASGEDAQRASRALILAAAQPLPTKASLSPLAERAARVAGAPFFVVGRSDSLGDFQESLKRAGPLAAQVAEILATAKWLTIAARPEKDRVRISVLGECESIWQATQLGLVLDGALVIARGAIQDSHTRKRLSEREVEHLEAVLSTVRVERRKDVVELRLEISAGFIAAAASTSKE